MKKIISITVLLMFLTISCQDDDTQNPYIEIPDIETGVFGNIEYGRANCMPGLGGNNTDYNNFNGEIYFILKSELEGLDGVDFEELKSNSIHFTIQDGKLEVELPIGVYLVMPEDIYLYSDYNTVTIESGIALYKNFKFTKCVVY